MKNAQRNQSLLPLSIIPRLQATFLQHLSNNEDFCYTINMKRWFLLVLISNASLGFLGSTDPVLAAAMEEIPMSFAAPDSCAVEHRTGYVENEAPHGCPEAQCILDPEVQRSEPCALSFVRAPLWLTKIMHASAPTPLRLSNAIAGSSSFAIPWTPMVILRV